MRSLSLMLLALCLIPVVAQDAGIRFNQVGYLPGAPKIAVFAGDTQATEFVLRSAKDNSVAYKGKLEAAPSAVDPITGDRPRLMDFSSFRKAGSYVLEVSGAGKSAPFIIGPDVYRRAFYLSMRSFYGQRCGMAVDLGKEFPGYSYPACHLVGEFHPTSGKSGPVKNTGGWHDAGDYGRYVVNSGITTGTLLWAYELFTPRIQKQNLEIPESSNKTPDFLDEIRWNLQWMLSMQDADGGAWHKQTTPRFSGFIMPDKDTMPSVVIGTGSAPYKSSCATADLAAVAAIAARVFRPYDAAFSETNLKAARSAWAWLEKNPNVLYSNPQGISTGGYGDRNCADERLWAAVEIYRTVGDDAAHQYFLQNEAKFRSALSAPPAWANLAPFALWSYALGKTGDSVRKADLKNAILQAEDAIVQRTMTAPYRNSMLASDYIWGSNSVAANYGVGLLVAATLSGKSSYRDAAIENLHYLLGRNPLSLSYVTQVGSNPFRHPHHRPSGADANPEPWPGLLSGGPNARRQDPAMKKLPDLPPARMFVDEQESYAANEIAINWNAPLVFLLAGALQ